MSHMQSRAAAKVPMSGTKKALIALLVLFLVALTGVAAVFLGVRHSINSQIRHVSTSLGSPTPQSAVQAQSTPSGDDINFLILGTDSRQSGGDPTDWEYGAQRSDVMMIMQISGDRKSVNIMSIPRDSWVDIPGYGSAKINAAYSFGGADLTIETVQNLTGITIDHFMVTDFTSFEQITDTLGGVTIATGEGVETFNGAEALTYVRERKSLARGDFSRMQRQQAWMRAIMQKAFDSSVLTDPAKLSDMISVLLAHSAVDETLTFDSMLSIASQLTSLRSSGVSFFTIPYTGTGTSEDGQSIVVLDTEAIAPLMEAWTTDSLANYVKTAGGFDVLGSGAVS